MAAAVTAGQQVGEYVLEAKVGEGAFGEVWRARHHVWRDHLVAVKIPSDPAYVSSLQREGISIHGLSHPNVVRAINFDPYGSPPYLVMEYVGGPSLRQVLRERGKLPAELAVAVLRQVLTALAYAHGRGVTHRDVKPENVLLAEGAVEAKFAAADAVKLADFGLGHQAAAAAAQSIAFSTTFSGKQGASIAGTLDYMAPEQREMGAAVDGRADLYACGVVLYEMLTGSRPVGMELPSALNPKVPKRLDEAFTKAFARLDRRFQSAEEFLKFLEEPQAAPAPSAKVAEAPKAAPPPKVRPAPPQRMAEPRKPMPVWPAIKALTLIALIVGGVLGATKAFHWYDLYSQSYTGGWKAYHIFVKDEGGTFSGSARAVAVQGDSVVLGVKSGDLGFADLAKAKNVGASLCVSEYHLSVRLAGGEVRTVTAFAPAQETVGNDVTLFLRVDAGGSPRLAAGTHFELYPTTATPGAWYSADKFGVARYFNERRGCRRR